MKRTHSIFVIMAFVVAALCLVSCDETQSDVGDEQKIFGRWKCTSINADTPPEGVAFWIKKGEILFIKSNHSYELIHGDETTEGGMWKEATKRIGFRPNRQQNYFYFSYNTDLYNTLSLAYSGEYLIELKRYYED